MHNYRFNFIHVYTHTQHTQDQNAVFTVRTGQNIWTIIQEHFTLVMLSWECHLIYMKIYILPSVFADYKDSVEFQIYLGLNRMQGYLQSTIMGTAY